MIVLSRIGWFLHDIHVTVYQMVVSVSFNTTPFKRWRAQRKYAGWLPGMCRSHLEAPWSLRRLPIAFCMVMNCLTGAQFGLTPMDFCGLWWCTFYAVVVLLIQQNWHPDQYVYHIISSICHTFKDIHGFTTHSSTLWPFNAAKTPSSDTNCCSPLDSDQVYRLLNDTRHDSRCIELRDGQLLVYDKNSVTQALAVGWSGLKNCKLLELCHRQVKYVVQIPEGMDSGRDCSWILSYSYWAKYLYSWSNIALFFGDVPSICFIPLAMVSSCTFNWHWLRECHDGLTSQKMKNHSGPRKFACITPYPILFHGSVKLEHKTHPKTRSNPGCWCLHAVYVLSSTF